MIEVNLCQYPLWTHAQDSVLGFYLCSRCGVTKPAVLAGMYAVFRVEQDRFVHDTDSDVEFICGMCNALDVQGVRRGG